MIAFDAFSNATPGAGNLIWDHTPVGIPSGVLVYIIQYLGVTDEVLGVTYGGLSLTEVTVSPVLKATGEAGAVYCYATSGSIPTGTQQVVVTTTGASVKAAGCATLTSVGSAVIQDAKIITSDSVANPFVPLLLGGKDCFCAIGFYSGQQTVGGVTPFANWSGYEFDFGNAIAGIYRYDVIGSADVNAGWTQTVDDAIAIALAVRDVDVPPDDKRARIHELFYAFSPPPPDENLDIVSHILDLAINATWTWAIKNTPDYVLNLPEVFKTRTNAAQKYLLLCLMASQQTDGLIVIEPPVPPEIP